MKWSCVSGGNCVEDVLGTYNSLAECQAALVPAPFTGGQCVSVLYELNIQFTVDYLNGSDVQVGGSTGNVQFINVPGKIISVTSPTINIYSGDFVGVVVQDIIVTYTSGFQAGTLALSDINPPFPASFGATKWRLNSITDITVVREDAGPDTCGNPPLQCP